LTTAAISNWKKRDRVPYNRLVRLVGIFGKDSEMAKFLAWVDTQEPSRLTPSRPFASGIQKLLSGHAAAKDQAEESPVKKPAGLFVSNYIAPTVPPFATTRPLSSLLIDADLSDKQKAYLNLGVRILNRVYRYSYLSEHISMEFVICQKPELIRLNFMRPMMRLLLLKAFEEEMTVQRRPHLLVYSTPEINEHKEMRQVSDECRMLGINVSFVMNPSSIGPALDHIDIPYSASEDEFETD
jgi:hypothetical protein